MTKLDFVFQTDKLHDGYKIGINLELKNDLSSDKYNELYSKISFVFKSFNYGMNIAKIIETIKTILLDAKEETYSIVIGVLNSKDKAIPINITNFTAGKLTDEIYKSTFNMNTAQYKELKGISNTKRNLRDSMGNLELAITNLAEVTANEMHNTNNSFGLDELKDDVQEASYEEK